MKVIAALLVLIPLATAHMCMLNPAQRGSMMGINKPGADDCNLEKPAPCGGRDDTGPPTQTFWAGMKNTVVFQKNLDHFNPNKPGPGNFTLNLWDNTGKQPTPIKVGILTAPDSNTTSPYLYVAEVDFTDIKPVEKAILQGVYYTNNPQAPATFYQCADVMVKMPPGN